VARVCPLCNGLQVAPKLCPRCGQEMEDKGALQEFIDPYSPYLSQELGENFAGTGDCVHLYCCPFCALDQRFSVPKQLI